MSAKTRSYVDQRLAEINDQANLREPPFAYWKALQAAERARAAHEKNAAARHRAHD